MINYKKNLILTLIVVILFVSAIGITYAYFSSNVIGNSNTSSNMVTTASKNIRYTDLSLLGNASMEPGWTSNKTIDVENIGSKTVTYDLVWQSITNNLTRQQDLVYEISCSSNVSGNTCSGITETQVPATGTNILVLDEVSIEAGEKHTYTITITYINQAVDQSEDMDKTVVGKLGVLDQ